MKALVERGHRLAYRPSTQSGLPRRVQAGVIARWHLLRTHRRLAADFPGRFKTISPAAIECHGDHVFCVGAEPTVHECVCRYRRSGNFPLRLASWPTASLLADAGYIDRAWFEQVNDAGGFYLVRGTQSLNPKIIQAWRGDGRKCQNWRDCHRKRQDGGAVGLRCWIWW